MTKLNAKYQPLDGGDHRRTNRFSGFAVGATISFIANFLLISFILSRELACKSSFAKLSPEISVLWQSKSPFYGEGTENDADRSWDSIDINNGSIALLDTYAESKGLPNAQRFPWDDSRGIYLLNGYHSMHCLKTIRQWVRETTNGVNTTTPAGHILHCLDALRQDVMCYADDTPRYTGYQESGRSGTGQSRQCRDWDKMEAWAQEHTACWRYLDEGGHELKGMERFKFCPEGSDYQSKVDEFFRNKKVGH